MLGKADIDESTRAEIIKQQNDDQLMAMLRQKEISMKMGMNL
jgi:hypothetical protein